MSVSITQVGEELNDEIGKWCENRSGWVNNRVKGCIAQRRSTNINFRHMRRICEIDNERMKRVKNIYLRKKEEARQELGRALHVHNGMVMKKICEGGNKSGLYGHIKMLIESNQADEREQGNR